MRSNFATINHTPHVWSSKHKSWVRIKSEAEKQAQAEHEQTLAKQYKRTNNCWHIQVKEIMDDNGDFHEECIKCKQRADWLPDLLEAL